MDIPLNLVLFLDSVIQKVAASLEGFDESFHPEVRLADPRFGDYQANGVLAFAKKQKQNPRELAQTLIDALQASGELPEEYFSMSIAGPGFINFKLSNRFLMEWLACYSSESSFKPQEHPYQGKVIPIDYSSPNTAKQMHVGHLRSMVIGEAIQRILRFHGAKMIRDNHIGDWGTQFGILLMEIKETGYDLDAEHEDAIEDLEKLYKQGSAKFKEDPAAQERARQELVKLQQGDPECVAIWKKISQVSWRAFDEIYKLFGVEFDETRGESYYKDKVDRVCRELEEDGIAEVSQGALVVFHPEHPRFKETPFLMRKADGASNYATTDLATALTHIEDFNADEILYVTDGRQQDHFAQLFLTVEKWFKKRGYKLPIMRHIWFGTILGEDGKAIKTRSGEPIKLKALVQEAIDRAYTLVSEKNPNLSEEEKQKIARVVGIGALRYADLAQNRTSDYVFSWDKMLAFDGNTAPYLLYAVARIYSIFRKIGESPRDYTNVDPETMGSLGEAGASLTRKLIAFPVALEQALGELRPHYLCTYLFELAGAFSTFYNADKVIVEAMETRKRRLTLCARTLCILEVGLHLPGIETLESM